MEKTTILVVDDDPKLSRLVKLFLERTGLYTVVEENRSAKALETARAVNPAAIVLDVDMPGKDGGEVARELHEDRTLGTRPVLFCTSLVSTGEVSRGIIMRGGQPFLAKPVNPTVLVQAVEALLERAALKAA